MIGTRKDRATALMSKQTISKYVRRVALLNLAAAAVVTVLTAYPLGWQRAFSVTGIAHSLVYSFCIGTLISAWFRFGARRFCGDSATRRFLQIISVIFAATFLGVTLASVVLSAVRLADWADVFPPRFGTFVFSSLIALMFGVSTFFYDFAQAQHNRTKERLRQTELGRARAETLATAAQLASLESRLHPHFLFNTLNSIAALIREDADLAEKTVERLADLLRYSLDANRDGLVELRQELEITRAYLEIERARFGERLDFEIRVDEPFFKTPIPPFALQTLIENAIKHVAAKRFGATRISVAAQTANDCLEIRVADDGDGFTFDDLKDGHGLDTLRKRLDSIYGAKANLEIDENANFGQVFLRVPLLLATDDEQYSNRNRVAAVAAARFSD